jgi:hypothetical protein
VTTPTWSTLSIDTTVALRSAASRLANEFTGTFGTETIERFLISSYDQLALHASVMKFLPLMAERFARQRLRAVARVEGLHFDGKPIDACPIFPGERCESWDDLDDPAGLDLAAARCIREDIERRVRQLIDELGLTSTG